jgi:ribosomal protein S18 acetylase RimI-like enzyme
MSSDLVVRPALAADAEAIARFQEAMALETEDKHLEPSSVRAGVRAVLLEPERGRYLVAERDGAAQGSLLLTREWSDWRAGWFWWIQSVYVAPHARRGGVFRALYAAVEREALSAGDVVGLRLYVEHDNRGAQRTYLDLGMRETGYRMFEAPLPGRPPGGK